MDGIGGNIGTGLIIIGVSIAIVVMLIVGAIWGTISYFSDDRIKSSKSVIYPSSYEIHGNAERVDTTYYYVIED